MGDGGCSDGSGSGQQQLGFDNLGFLFSSFFWGLF